MKHLKFYGGRIAKGFQIVKYKKTIHRLFKIAGKLGQLSRSNKLYRTQKGLT
jgi:hypothetical protein